MNFEIKFHFRKKYIFIHRKFYQIHLINENARNNFAKISDNFFVRHRRAYNLYHMIDFLPSNGLIVNQEVYVCLIHFMLLFFL